MHVTLTLTLNETDARRLWSRCDEGEGDPPIDNEMADWLSNFCVTTIQSNFQFDASVCPIIESEGHTDTLLQLLRLKAYEAYIGDDRDKDTPTILNAKLTVAQITAALTSADDPEEADQELQTLLDAYAVLLKRAVDEVEGD